MFEKKVFLFLQQYTLYFKYVNDLLLKINHQNKSSLARLKKKICNANIKLHLQFVFFNN